MGVKFCVGKNSLKFITSASAVIGYLSLHLITQAKRYLFRQFCYNHTNTSRNLIPYSGQSPPDHLLLIMLVPNPPSLPIYDKASGYIIEEGTV